MTYAKKFIMIYASAQHEYDNVNLHEIIFLYLFSYEGCFLLLSTISLTLKISPYLKKRLLCCTEAPVNIDTSIFNLLFLRDFCMDFYLPPIPPAGDYNLHHVFVYVRPCGGACVSVSRSFL